MAHATLPHATSPVFVSLGANQCAEAKVIIEVSNPKSLIIKVGDRVVMKEDKGVLMKVLACGLCGTDVASVNGFLPFPYPLIVGHEIVAQIVGGENRFLIEINASHWAYGKENIGTCGWCQSSEEGDDSNSLLLVPSSMHIHCNHRRTVGIDRMIGGTSPFIMIPKRSCIPIPSDCPLSNELLTLCEPTAAAIQAIACTKFTNGDAVAILGPKRLGMLIIACLVEIRSKSNENSPMKHISITAIHRHQKQLDIAFGLGADSTVHLRNTSITSLVSKYDVVFDCTGTESGFEIALQICRSILHLKSTCGASCFGIKEWTAFVVDELSLMAFRDQNVLRDFRFSPALPSIVNQPPIYLERIYNIYCSPTIISHCSERFAAFKDIHKEEKVQYHILPYQEALHFCNSMKNPMQTWNSPFPRYDIALVSSLDEIDSIIRPDVIHSIGVSLLLSRSPIIMLSPNEVPEENELEKKLYNGVRIRSSRCGNLLSAFTLLSDSANLCSFLTNTFISDVLPFNNVQEGLKLAQGASSSKVILSSHLIIE